METIPARRTRVTTFVADAMLGSLARKLRALGFDTDYYRGGDDAGLLRLAEASQRVILTADRSLAERAGALGIVALLIVGTDDKLRLAALVQLAKSAGIRLVRGDSLCSVCGGRLASLTRDEAKGSVPASVGRRHRVFYTCIACSRYYWRGSHWKKLRRLERILQDSV